MALRTWRVHQQTFRLLGPLLDLKKPKRASDGVEEKASKSIKLTNSKIRRGQAKLSFKKTKRPHKLPAAEIIKARLT